MVARFPGETLIPRLLILLIILWSPRLAAGQNTGRWDVQASNVSLDDALRVFSNRTGSAVAYDPNVTRSVRISCGIRDADLEAYLGCLLTGTGLEFFRRASGTYVIGLAVALPDSYGIVAGTVQDSSSGEAVVSAHVVVAGVNRGVISGIGGGFLLADLLPGRYSVAVTHVGYSVWTDSVDVLAGARTRVRARLSSNVYTLKPVVVRQTGTSLLPRQDPERVTRGPLQPASPASSFSDMTSRIHVQGSDAGDLRLRLDGSPVYLPREFATFIGPFSNSAVSSVRVSTAGYGASGGSLLGGALDFRQRTTGEDNFSVSVDPLSVDASISGVHRATNLSSTKFMAAARIGLWNRTRPTELARTVASWSRTDPFLLFGPARDYAKVTEESLQGLFELAPVVPDVQFSDVHGTVEHETASGQTWRLSLYTASRGLSGDRRAGMEAGLASDGPLISSVAENRWSSTTATLSWRDLVGERTFVQAAIHGSLYRYQQKYALAEQVGIDPSGSGAPQNELVGAETLDGNDLDEFAFRIRVDQSRGGHALSAGSEITHTASRFDLRLASLEGGEVVDVLSSTGGVDAGSVGFDTTSIFLVRHGAIRNRSGSLRIAAWVADRIETEAFSVELSTRFTLRPDRKTVYVEPRARAAWRLSRNVVLAWSGGFYRQFVNQFDFSSVNAGGFVPSARIWLPLDRTLRPGRALHSAVDLDWSLSTNWRVSGAAYWKRIDGALVIDYAIDPALIVDGATLDQSQLLTRRDARHAGASVSAQYTGPLGLATLEYLFARDRVQSDALFGGRWLPAPWEVPHRLATEWGMSLGPVSLSAAGTVEAGQAWALRQVYYDYFGQREESRLHAGWNLARPDEHPQPARITLDIGGRYDWLLGQTKLEFRFEIKNLMDRANQIDQRLLWDGSRLVGDARYLPGRTMAVGVRAAW